MSETQSTANYKMCLVSKHLSATQLIAYLCGLFADLSTKACIFKVDLKS